MDSGQFSKTSRTPLQLGFRAAFRAGHVYPVGRVLLDPPAFRVQNDAASEEMRQ